MPAPTVVFKTNTGVANIKPVGGLIAVLDETVVGAGNWTKAFSGTNKAAYKQPTASGDFYLRVDDSNAGYSEVRGYKNMTDVDTGTDEFPDSANPFYCRRYDGVEATDPGEWVVFWTDNMFQLYNKYGTADDDVSCVIFGKPNMINTADAYGCILMASASSSGTSSQASYHARHRTTAGGVWCRNNDGLAGDLPLYRRQLSDTSYLWSLAAVSHPLPGASSSYIDPLVLCDDSSYSIQRGTMPGWLCGAAQRPWTHEATVSLTGDYSGSDAYFIYGYSSAGVLISTHADLWD